MATTLWCDLYEPRYLDKLYLCPELKIQMERLSSMSLDSIPHLMFHGPRGSGKRTLVYAFLRRICGWDRSEMHNIDNISVHRIPMQSKKKMITPSDTTTTVPIRSTTKSASRHVPPSLVIGQSCHHIEVKLNVNHPQQQQQPQSSTSCFLDWLHSQKCTSLKRLSPSVLSPSQSLSDSSTSSVSTSTSVSTSIIPSVTTLPSTTFSCTPSTPMKKSGSSTGTIRFVVVHELEHHMSRLHQQVLQTPMDKLSPYFRWIVITDSMSKILTSLKSRFLAVRVQAPSNENMRRLLYNMWRINRPEELQLFAKSITTINTMTTTTTTTTTTTPANTPPTTPTRDDLSVPECVQSAVESIIHRNRCNIRRTICVFQEWCIHLFQVMTPTVTPGFKMPVPLIDFYPWDHIVRSAVKSLAYEPTIHSVFKLRETFRPVFIMCVPKSMIIKSFVLSLTRQISQLTDTNIKKDHHCKFKGGRSCKRGDSSICEMYHTMIHSLASMEYCTLDPYLSPIHIDSLLSSIATLLHPFSSSDK